MAERRPLVLVGGRQQELPAQDTLPGGVAGYSYQEIFSTQTLQANYVYLVNTYNGAFSASLPINPSFGDNLHLRPMYGQLSVNNLTVARNGSTIRGVDDDFVMDTNYGTHFVFDGDTWQVYEDVLALTDFATYYVPPVYNEDLSQLSYVRKSTVTINTSRALYIHPDGTYLYYVDGPAKTRRFTLSTPYNVGTMGSQVNWDNGVNLTKVDQITSLTFNPNGSRYFVGGDDVDNDDRVFQFNLSPAWTDTTAALAGESTIQGLTFDGIAFNPDGTQVLLDRGSSGQIYTCPSAYNISGLTGSPIQTSNIFVNTESRCGLVWGKDGTKLFCVEVGSEYIREYTVTTPYTLDGISITDTVDLSVLTGIGNLKTYAMHYVPSVGKMYVIGIETPTYRVYEFQLAEV